MILNAAPPATAERDVQPEEQELQNESGNTPIVIPDDVEITDNYDWSNPPATIPENGMNPPATQASILSGNKWIIPVAAAGTIAAVVYLIRRKRPAKKKKA